jgi:hypothetical protein
MKITPPFIAGIVLCAAPFALAVRGDLKKKDRPEDELDRYGLIDRDYDTDDDDYSDYKPSDYSADDYDPPDPEPDNAIEKQDLLQLIGSEPGTMGPVLDGLKLGASSEDFQPDVTRERIATYVEDHDYRATVDFDFDDVSLNAVVVTVRGDEEELRDVMISAWGTPKRLSEDELVWLGPVNQRAVYAASSDGFDLRFEIYTSVDNVIGADDKTKLAIEPFPIVGGSVKKLRTALGTKLQESSYDGEAAWAAPGIGAGRGRTMVTVGYEDDKINVMVIEGTTADAGAITDALTAKWGAPKQDDEGNDFWKSSKGVKYSFESYDQGFSLRAER